VLESATLCFAMLAHCLTPAGLPVIGQLTTHWQREAWTGTMGINTIWIGKLSWIDGRQPAERVPRTHTGVAWKRRIDAGLTGLYPTEKPEGYRMGYFGQNALPRVPHRRIKTGISARSAVAGVEQLPDRDLLLASHQEPATPGMTSRRGAPGIFTHNLLYSPITVQPAYHRALVPFCAPIGAATSLALELLSWCAQWTTATGTYQVHDVGDIVRA